MTHRIACIAFACAAIQTGASAQVSTFTAGGGGPVALAPTSARPASRSFVGPTFVNAHQDVAPGVAERLAPPVQSRSANPMRYGASPALADIRIALNIGPTAVAFDPWVVIEGNGHLETMEAARVDFLERYGLRGGVRTHANSAAETIRAERPSTRPEPRGVIRVRPAAPSEQTPGIVDASR